MGLTVAAAAAVGSSKLAAELEESLAGLEVGSERSKMLHSKWQRRLKLRMAGDDRLRVAGGDGLEIVKSGGLRVNGSMLGVASGGFREAGGRADGSLGGTSDRLGVAGGRLEIDRVSLEIDRGEA